MMMDIFDLGEDCIKLSRRELLVCATLGAAAAVHGEQAAGGGSSTPRSDWFLKHPARLSTRLADARPARPKRSWHARAVF